jgi:hypothetical protein
MSPTFPSIFTPLQIGGGNFGGGNLAVGVGILTGILGGIWLMPNKVRFSVT